MATPETHAMTVSDEIQADADGMADTTHSLLLSARSGDWETAKKILEGEPNVKKQVTSTKKGIDILDAAVNWGRWEYFIELLQVMNAQTLATKSIIRDGVSMTILHRVAHIHGSMKSAQALVQKCPSLTQITDLEGFTPLFTAINVSNDSDLIWYLASVTTNQEPGCPFTGSPAATLLCALISVGYYDILHFILQRHHHLAQMLLTAKVSVGKPVLEACALQPSDFPSGTKLGWLARCIYPSHYYRKFQSLVWNTMEKLVPGVRRIRDTKFKQECAIKLVNIACTETKWSPKFYRDPDFQDVISITLEAAIRYGISEILSIYMTKFPPSSDDINHYKIGAIRYRQDKVFNLFLRKYPKSQVELYWNNEKINTLHITAQLGDCPKITSIAGAAFQMQEELQWFKVIEKLVSPRAKRQVSTNNETPWELFTKEHEIMRKEGEKWMKGTSKSCMLVATLIATVVFAAVFTVPGGNHEENGTPIFLQKNTFLLFAVFDALALFSSINSLWMFLSILTARFAFEDFLRTLPKRLVFGLASLFLAIVSAMTAFGAALSLVLGHRQNVVTVLIILMALISVAMFAILQLPLFIEMVRSTYFPRLLGS